jgi:hypothetical protein
VVPFATSHCNVGPINANKFVTLENVSLVVRSLDISVIVGGTAVFSPVEKESYSIVLMDETNGMEDSHVTRFVTGGILAFVDSIQLKLLTGTLIAESTLARRYA